MSQLNTEKSNLFERLFGEETTDQCMARDRKTREEFDTAFFETQITDQEYRRKRAFFEENVDNKNTETLGGKNNRLIENQMIISDKNKYSRTSLPTAAGFKSIGARSSGGNNPKKTPAERRGFFNAVKLLELESYTSRSFRRCSVLIIR